MNYSTWLGIQQFRTPNPRADEQYTQRLFNSSTFSGLPIRHFIMARIAHVGMIDIGENGLGKWGQFADTVY